MESKEPVERHVTAVSFQKKNTDARDEDGWKNREKLKRESFLRADSDQIDLDALLQAVLDISGKINDDKDKSCRVEDSKTDTSRRETPEYVSRALGSSGDEAESGSNETNRRFSDYSTNSDRATRNKQVHGGPFIRKNGFLNQDPRKNLSFTNEKVYDIDRENERLLRKISKGPRRAKVNQKKREPVKVLSSSEINRQRQQQKIERENLAFLGRLQKVKPSKDLSRKHLLDEQSKRGRQSTNRIPAGPALRRPGSSSSSLYSNGYSTRSSNVIDLRDLDNASVASRNSNSSRRQASSSSASYSKSFGSSRLKQSTYIKPIWEPGW